MTASGTAGVSNRAELAFNVSEFDTKERSGASRKTLAVSRKIGFPGVRHKTQLTPPRLILQVWLHETCRVYRDRLVEPADAQRVNALLNQVRGWTADRHRPPESVD